MIKHPQIGMRVITGSQKCCGSEHKKGTKGVIVEINPTSGIFGNIDSGINGEKDAIVVYAKGETWVHCPDCLDELK